MIADIKCLTCGELMGTIEKPVITDRDILLYHQMQTCSLGHKHASTTDDLYGSIENEDE